ncbi:hypothetical protein M3J09_002440 [Ascochyta lentis]
MTNALHGVLNTITNAPTSLSARLLDPAPIREPEQRALDLTPPRVVKRKRRLTLPLNPPVSVSAKAKWFSKADRQRTYHQAQSPLMQLPAELRDQIWKYVILGNNDGEMAIGWRSTGHSHGRASAFTVSFDKPRGEWGPGVLGMLCSCRVIYSETINLIYSLPTFSFRYQNTETFLAFVGAILPHRRNLVRALDLRCLGQGRVSDTTLQPLEHQMNPKWSYARISTVKALSELPRPVMSELDADFVRPERVVEEVLRGMEGLRKGGVRWGCKSTGCFERVKVGRALDDGVVGRLDLGNHAVT